jgi:tetratricopeptide (TPR) repeat protein
VRLWLVFVVLSLGGLPLAAPAHAQEASSAEMSAARDLFREGLEAARAERWEEAREAFSRSFDIVPRNSTLLNLAGAQAETGRLVAARASYRRFLDQAGARERPLVASAEEALADVDRRIARVTIEAPGLVDEDEVWLDDDVVGHASLGVPLPVDPGDHVITVARGGAAAGEASFTVAEGEATEVRVAVTEREEPAAVAILPSATETADRDDDGSIWASPWLWIAVGVVVVAAVAIPVGIAASSSPAEPYRGNLGAGSLSF